MLESNLGEAIISRVGFVGPLPEYVTRPNPEKNPFGNYKNRRNLDASYDYQSHTDSRTAQGADEVSSQIGCDEDVNGSTYQHC